MRKSTIASFTLLLIVVVGSAWYAHSHKVIAAKHDNKLQIVAAENFWGSLVSQIGGNKVQVLSIVSDPNADPHEYESSSKDARAVATANYVVINGAGYDSWAQKLLSASPNSKRMTLNVANLNGVKTGDNPHMWYNPQFVNRTTAQMEQTLIKLDPGDKRYFVAQYRKLTTNLAVYQGKIATIKKQYAGTKVAATEDIFVYLANAMGLDLISPPSFIEAVAEGNDPPTSSVVTFQQQLKGNEPKLLVYNEQTVTPLTTSVKTLAGTQKIPIIGVTETMQPVNTTFQSWMNTEVANIQTALKQTRSVSIQ
jgi:zinc/manganese transport system substrate-binding protein